MKCRIEADMCAISLQNRIKPFPWHSLLRLCSLFLVGCVFYNDGKRFLDLTAFQLYAPTFKRPILLGRGGLGTKEDRSQAPKDWINVTRPLCFCYDLSLQNCYWQNWQCSRLSRSKGWTQEGYNTIHSSYDSLVTHGLACDTVHAFDCASIQHAWVMHA